MSLHGVAKKYTPKICLKFYQQSQCFYLVIFVCSKTTLA